MRVDSLGEFMSDDGSHMWNYLHDSVRGRGGTLDAYFRADASAGVATGSFM